MCGKIRAGIKDLRREQKFRADDEGKPPVAGSNKRVVATCFEFPVGPTSNFSEKFDQKMVKKLAADSVELSAALVDGTLREGIRKHLGYVPGIESAYLGAPPIKIEVTGKTLIDVFAYLDFEPEDNVVLYAQVEMELRRSAVALEREFRRKRALISFHPQFGGAMPDIRSRIYLRGE